MKTNACIVVRVLRYQDTQIASKPSELEYTWEGPEDGIAGISQELLFNSPYIELETGAYLLIGPFRCRVVGYREKPPTYFIVKVEEDD